MTDRVRGRWFWLVQVTIYVLVAAVLLLRAMPVNWDTPTNLAYQEGWASLAFVVGVVAFVFGSVQGVLWARGVRVGGVLACLFGAAFAFAAAGFFLDGPIANGGEGWTAGREQVVMSQLAWGGFWATQTLVAAAWLLVPVGSQVSRSDAEGAVAAESTRD